MTTRVLVLTPPFNHQAVLVETLANGPEGTTVVNSKVLDHGFAHEFNVYDGQALRISETPRPEQAPATPAPTPQA